MWMNQRIISFDSYMRKLVTVYQQDGCFLSSPRQD
jgi:hypothetical protein